MVPHSQGEREGEGKSKGRERRGGREKERVGNGDGERARARARERKTWALRPQKPLRLIRDGDVGGSGILYLTPTRYTVTTRMILH